MPSLSGLRLAALVAALALAPAAARALTPQEIFAKVSPAVWVVRAHHAQDGSTALGSAVVIAPRLLVTACHVVAGATAVEVARDAGKSIVPIATVTPGPGPHPRPLPAQRLGRRLRRARRRSRRSTR